MSVLQKSVADSTLRALRNVFNVNGYVVNARNFVIDMICGIRKSSRTKDALCIFVGCLFSY